MHIIKMLHYDYMDLTVSDLSLKENAAEMSAWTRHIS